MPLFQETEGYSEGRQWLKGNLLGHGAYSTCYLARDIVSGAIMAVKQISLKSSSPRIVSEEVGLLSRLRHPHTLRMIGAVQEGDRVNVFVEWMAGGSIASLLERFGAFADRSVIAYARQALLGLDYLHYCGILHRDLKGKSSWLSH